MSGELLFKILVIAILLFILLSLSGGLFFLIKDKKKNSILGNSDFLAKNNLLGLSNSSELAKNDFKNYMNYHLDLSTAKPLNKFENYPREYSV